MTTARSFSAALTRALRRAAREHHEPDLLSVCVDPHHDDGGDGTYHCAWQDAVEFAMRNNKARVYGIELEVPYSCNGRRSVDWRGLHALRALRTSDGSLRCDDIEFNFPPLTAAAIKRGRIIDRTLEALNRATHEPHDYQYNTYGIHIHSNIQWMKPKTPYIVSHLVRDNDRFFKWVAGRVGYSSYGSATDHFTGKYATCLQPCRHTLEWRIFRSTYNQRLVNVWLDLIRAVEDWAELPITQDAYGVTGTGGATEIVRTPVDPLARFFSFVSANRRKYGTVSRIIDAYDKSKNYTVYLIERDLDDDYDDGEDADSTYVLTNSLEDHLHTVYPERRPRPARGGTNAVPAAA